MAAIAVKASRFALLKVEDDYDSDEKDSKAKNDKTGQQAAAAAAAAKKKSKKKKKSDQTTDEVCH